MSSLSFLAIFFHCKFLWLIFFWRVKKTKCFAAVLSMLAVMNVMSMNHALQVAASFFRQPLDALVHDDVMENKIKEAIAKNAQPHGDKIWIVGHQGGVVEQPNGGKTKDGRKPVVSFQRMIVYRVVRAMPSPQEAVHDVFMRGPRHPLPKQKCGNDNDGTRQDRPIAHDLFF